MNCFPLVFSVGLLPRPHHMQAGSIVYLLLTKSGRSGATVLRRLPWRVSTYVVANHSMTNAKE